MSDCVVVGGGLIGMFTARELARAGMTVTLLERNVLGQEASWAGGGIISPLYPWRYNEAVTRLVRWSQAAYPQLAAEIERESGLDPEWTQSGLLILDSDEQRQAVDWAQKYNYPCEIIAPEDVLGLEPALESVGSEGIWLPEVAQVRNPRLIKAMRGCLLHHGVRVVEGAEVDGLIIQQGRITGVRVNGQAQTAGRVVITSGAWSAGLLQELGVRLQVKPVRGQMLLFRGRPGMVSRIVLSRDRYVIPRRDGRILVGSTLEDVGFDKSTTATARQQLIAEAKRLVPALASMEIEHQWAGLRPATPDGTPYIYADQHVPGLYVNTGHFRNGVVLGPASARLMADIVLDQTPILPPKPYSLCV